MVTLNPRLIKSFAIGAALVLVPALIGSALPSRSLISLGNSGSSTGMAAESTDAKMMMPNPFTYEYLAGAGLDDMDGKGRVYQIVREGDAKTILTKVAEAMGLSGEVVEADYSSPDFPSYAIGAQDGKSRSVVITWVGTGGWYYQDPGAYPNAVCNEFTKGDDGVEYCSSYAEQAPTPELIANKGELVTEAVRLFNLTGLKVKAEDIRVERSDWGASASASLKVDGQDTPLEWALYWGSNGKIASLSGQSVKIVDRGEHQTISAKSAVGRIADWRYSGQISSSDWAKYQPSSPDLSGRIQYDDMVSESQPVEPIKVTVTINKSAQSLMLIWDKAGNAWLVPGHILISDEGWISPVFALADGVVELPEPVEISPMLR